MDTALVATVFLTITMLQGFGWWAVRLARSTSLVIGFRHESRELGQELNTFGRMGLTGQMNRQNLKSIALLRQFWGQFHQQSYHFQRRCDIDIIGPLLRGWWLDIRPRGFVIVVVVLFIGPFRLDIT